MPSDQLTENANPAAGSTQTGDGHTHAGTHVVTHARPGTGRRIGILVLALTIVLSGFYFAGRIPRRRRQSELEEATRGAKESAPAVNVARPTQAPAISELSLPGEARAFYETTIFARISGYVNHWLVDIGDRVKTGQSLATIDTPELDAQLMEARAKVGASEAEVRLAEAQVAFAKITYDRWEAAAPEGAVSQQERDEKKAEFTNAQARLDVARAQREFAKSTVKKLEFEAGFKNVTAPFDGVITQRHVDVGSLITAGSTANTTPLFAIAQYDQVRVFTKVPQTASSDITVGMEAGISSKEYPERHFSGKVDRTAGAIDPGSRTLKVEVLAANPDLALLPGMYVTVNFQVVRTKPAMVIRASALNYRTGGPQIAVVDPGGRVHFRNVEIARDLGDSIEIARDLGPQEWVAVNISDEIAEGDIVKPVPLQDSSAHLAAATPTLNPRESSNEPKTIAASTHSSEAVR
ncbi:MAG TPA: efflux RND transporter periplasmic adaptor subunit [Phycisphaerae bacterium]|nr:efflux RND transporter periplasmic adaptor subunit [Phycisphaerae bacterium]